MQNYRIKWGKKERILSQVCMIKKQRLRVLLTSDVMKRVYLKAWFTRHQICRQDLLVKYTCQTQKIRPDFFYFGLPFTQRKATCKLAATEDYRMFIKLHFGAVQLSIVSPTEWLERLIYRFSQG